MDSLHVISYALLFCPLFINIPRPTPYCFSAILWLANTAEKKTPNPSQISFRLIESRATRFHKRYLDNLWVSHLLCPWLSLEFILSAQHSNRTVHPLPNYCRITLQQSWHRNALTVVGNLRPAQYGRTECRR